MPEGASRLPDLGAGTGKLTRQLCDAGSDVVAVEPPSFDLATADGRTIARILASNDAVESGRIAERVSRAARQRAEDGDPALEALTDITLTPTTGKDGGQGEDAMIRRAVLADEHAWRLACGISSSLSPCLSADGARIGPRTTFPG